MNERRRTAEQSPRLEGRHGSAGALLYLAFFFACFLYLTFKFCSRLDIAVLNICFTVSIAYTPFLFRVSRPWATRTQLVYCTTVVVVSYSALFIEWLALSAWGGRASLGLIWTFVGTLFSGSNQLEVVHTFALFLLFFVTVIAAYLCALSFLRVSEKTTHDIIGKFTRVSWLICAAITLTCGIVGPRYFSRIPVFMAAGIPDVRYFSDQTVTRLQSLAEDAANRQLFQKFFESRSQPHEASHHNVAIILSDALRADHLSAYGYNRNTSPFLEAEIREGRAFKVANAFTSCPDTACALATLFSGRPLRSVSRTSLKFYDILRMAGMKVHMILAGEHRHWDFLDGFYGEVDSFFDFRQSSIKDPGSDRVVIEGLQRRDFSKDSNFLYIHMMSTHPTGTLEDEFRQFLPATTPFIELTWHASPPSMIVQSDLLAFQPSLIGVYDNRVLQADSYVRQIFDELRKSGFFSKPATVFFLADHGASLGEHEHVGHGRRIYQEALTIPLLIWDSEPSRYRERDFGTLFDISLTILDRLSLPMPQEWSGRSLLSEKVDREILVHTNYASDLWRGSLSWDHTKQSLKKILISGHKSSEQKFAYVDLSSNPRELDLAWNTLREEEISPKLAEILSNLPAAEIAVDFAMLCDNL